MISLDMLDNTESKNNKDFFPLCSFFCLKNTEKWIMGSKIWNVRFSHLRKISKLKCNVYFKIAPSSIQNLKSRWVTSFIFMFNSRTRKSQRSIRAGLLQTDVQNCISLAVHNTPSSKESQGYSISNGIIRWRRDGLPTLVFLGFPCGSAGKESACNAGDLGLIPYWEGPLENGKATHSSILA